MNTLPVNHLQNLYKENEIGLIELEFARFLLRLEPSIHNEVLFTAIIAVQEQLNGNICTDLSSIYKSNLASKFSLTDVNLDILKQELLASNLVGSYHEYKPLILEENRLYLQKYWSLESKLINWLVKKTKQNDTALKTETFAKIDELFPPSDELNYQKVAVLLSVLKSFLIISGGPGTGKTYTVKKIVEALAMQNPNLKIAMAAPTGKAAERLNSSLVDLEGAPEATTLHRLLGARMDGNFRYNEQEKLLYDVVIVDEASMLDIGMWVSLTDALKNSAKLILLGDKDQLSSVEAGSVLGDICEGAGNTFSDEVLSILNKKENQSTLFSTNSVLSDHVVLLNKSYRTGEETGIPQFARAINEQDMEKFDSTVEAFNSIKILEPSEKNIQPIIQNYCSEIINGDQITQILCSNKKGDFGTININDRVEISLKRKLGIPLHQEWYEGRRILITQNNYSLKLSNGQIGTCLKTKDHTFIIQFDSETQVSPSELSHYSPAFAITVHKSQGSEFDNIVLFLPEQHNSVLFKELLYTAVTRARQNTLVIGSRDIITQTVQSSARRSSGIPNKLNFNQ